MERPKPINQNKTQKKPNSGVHHKTENNLAKTICQRSRIREKIYPEISNTNQNLCFLRKEIKINKSFPTKAYTSITIYTGDVTLWGGEGDR